MAKNTYQLGQAKMTNTRMRGPMRMIEKPKDMKGALRMLIQYLRKFIVPLCAALACAVVSVILTLFAPDGMNRITSLIEEGMDAGALDTRQVLAISAAVLLFYLLSSGLAFIQGISLASTTQSVMRHMRNDISRKLNRIPLSRFDHSSFGDLLSRVTNDVDTIGMSLSHGVVDVVTAAATFIGVAIMMLLTNLWMWTELYRRDREGFLQRLLFSKAMLEHFGLPILTSELVEVSMDYYDRLLARGIPTEQDRP